MTTLIKVTFVVLAALTCCQCKPGYRREQLVNAETRPVEVIQKQEESPHEVKEPSPAEEKKEPDQPQDPSNKEKSLLQGQDDNVQELMNLEYFDQSPPSQQEHVDSVEEEPQLIQVQIPKSTKTQLEGDKYLIKSGTKLEPDSYRKSLQRFFRGIMERVLQAEIMEVRVEEMSPKHTRKEYE